MELIFLLACIPVVLIPLKFGFERKKRLSFYSLYCNQLVAFLVAVAFVFFCCCFAIVADAIFVLRTFVNSRTRKFKLENFLR